MSKGTFNHQAGFCPVCGASDLIYGAHNMDGDELTYDWTCPKCKSEGEEIYVTTFLEHEIRHKGKVPKT